MRERHQLQPLSPEDFRLDHDFMRMETRDWPTGHYARPETRFLALYEVVQSAETILRDRQTVERVSSCTFGEDRFWLQPKFVRTADKKTDEIILNSFELSLSAMIPPQDLHGTAKAQELIHIHQQHAPFPPRIRSFIVEPGLLPDELFTDEFWIDPFRSYGVDAQGMTLFADLFRYADNPQNAPQLDSTRIQQVFPALSSLMWSMQEAEGFSESIISREKGVFGIGNRAEIKSTHTPNGCQATTIRYADANTGFLARIDSGLENQRRWTMIRNPHYAQSIVNAGPTAKIHTPGFDELLTSIALGGVDPKSGIDAPPQIMIEPLRRLLQRSTYN